jgi:hypothetical protein
LEWLVQYDSDLSIERRQQIEMLRDEVARTEWQMPTKFGNLEFAVAGIGKRLKGWPLPAGARQVGIISPFVRASALKQLADEMESDTPITLVCRPEELSKLPTSFVGKERWRLRVLHQSLFEEVGEDGVENLPAQNAGDVHAKVYFADYAVGRGGNLSIVVGSANATNAALVKQRNVEIMVRLTGRHTAVGTCEDLLGPEALGRYLGTFEWPMTAGDVLPSEAEAALESARQLILSMKWQLRFEPAGPGEWSPILAANGMLGLPEGVSARVWLMTVPEGRAAALTGLGVGNGTRLANCATADATAFVSFALARPGADEVRMALNLPDVELPSGRDAAVMRGVIADGRAFLAYLRFLLGDLGGIESLDELIRSGAGDGGTPAGGIQSVPLLEDMVRALGHAPERLLAVQRLMQQMDTDSDLQAVIPPGFRELWASFSPLVKSDSVP